MILNKQLYLMDIPRASIGEAYLHLIENEELSIKFLDNLIYKKKIEIIKEYIKKIKFNPKIICEHYLRSQCCKIMELSNKKKVSFCTFVHPKACINSIYCKYKFKCLFYHTFKDRDFWLLEEKKKEEDEKKKDLYKEKKEEFESLLNIHIKNWFKEQLLKNHPDKNNNSKESNIATQALNEIKTKYTLKE
jgi:hypothetical protein